MESTRRKIKTENYILMGVGGASAMIGSYGVNAYSGAAAVIGMFGAAVGSATFILGASFIAADIFEKRKAMIIAGGIAATFYLGGLGYVAYNKANNLKTKEAPHTQIVERGFADPSQIEIISQDEDRNGQNETLLRYGDRNYSVRLNPSGEPFLDGYESPKETSPQTQPSR